VIQIPRDKPPERTERPRLWPELTAGFSAVRRNPSLRVIVGLTGAQTLTSGALEVLLVVLGIQLLHAGNAGVGWLNAAIGIGSILGAFVVAMIAARRRLATGFAIGIVVSVVPLALAAAVSSLAPALVLFGILGAGSVLVEVGGITLLQRSAENEVLGRVFAVLETTILGSLAVGAIVTPALVSWLGARGALIAAGVFVPVLLVPVWPSLRRIDAEAVIAEEPLALLRRIPMFAELPEPALERLARTATAVSTAAGQVVVALGEVGNHFYAIAAGRAAVEQADGTTRELGPGEFFGEIALLRDVPRTATVRAIEPLQLYAIARDDFLAAVTEHEPTLASVEYVVTSRLPAGVLQG
jgi:MFS family permease